MCSKLPPEQPAEESFLSIYVLLNVMLSCERKSFLTWLNFRVCIACASTEWTCGDGTCIPLEGRCNGRYECRDYSDEDRCPELSLNDGRLGSRHANLFLLYSMQSWRVDLHEWGLHSHRSTLRQNPALDGSDEENCPPQLACASTEWTCGDGTCIPLEGRCNGRYECRDYSDEDRCPACSPGEWTCMNGDCIPTAQHCDRIPHCRDGSDEENCPPQLEGRCNGRYECRDYSDEDRCPGEDDAASEYPLISI
nr:low-density lipoprotein receptor 1-like [Penaeus vannamei]